MDRESKKDWSWVDWMRFLFYRQATIPFSCFKYEGLYMA